LSPVDREELAALLLRALPALPARRTLYVGGPETWTATALRALAGPGTAPARWPWSPRTAWGALPPGDLSVMPETTRASLGAYPAVGLAQTLAAAAERPALHRGLTRTDAPVPPHPADPGGPIAALPALDPALRRHLHAALCADLHRLGLSGPGLQLDWSGAQAVPEIRPVRVGDGALTPVNGVRVRTADGAVAFVGDVRLHWDARGESLSVWFARPGGGIPPAIWEALDLGVQRRARR
jgi:hypothetical protein